MEPLTADRNLLFGMMALQNEMVNRDELLDAFQSWTLNKHLSIRAILEEKGFLGSDVAHDIDRLLEKRISKAGGEPKLMQQFHASDDIYMQQFRA